GDVPSPANPPVGCNCNTRCPVARDVCYEKEPDFVDVGGGHWVACFRA
ncbi:MAG: peptide ABC transporter substrate-binding protein, partial [Chloroflexi bacterium]